MLKPVSKVCEQRYVREATQILGKSIIDANTTNCCHHIFETGSTSTKQLLKRIIFMSKLPHLLVVSLFCFTGCSKKEGSGKKKDIDPALLQGNWQTSSTLSPSDAPEYNFHLYKFEGEEFAMQSKDSDNIDLCKESKFKTSGSQLVLIFDEQDPCNVIQKKLKMVTRIMEVSETEISLRKTSLDFNGNSTWLNETLVRISDEELNRELNRIGGKSKYFVENIPDLMKSVFHEIEDLDLYDFDSDDSF